MCTKYSDQESSLSNTKSRGLLAMGRASEEASEISRDHLSLGWEIVFLATHTHTHTQRSDLSALPEAVNLDLQ
jgi:hypothetical protein